MDDLISKEKVVKPSGSNYVEAYVGLLTLYEYLKSDNTFITSVSNDDKDYKVVPITELGVEINNIDSYLNLNSSWGLMTSITDGQVWIAQYDGANGRWRGSGIRPSIVLKSGVMYSSGDGSSTLPYVLVD